MSRNDSNNLCIENALEALNAGLINDAQRMFKACLKASPDSAKAHYYLAKIALQRAEYTDALESMTICLNLDPKMHVARLDIANTYMILKDFEKAKYHLNLINASNSKDKSLLNSCALLYISLDETEKALKVLREAYILDKNCQNVLYNLAYAYAKLEKFSESLYYLDKIGITKHISENFIIMMFDLYLFCQSPNKILDKAPALILSHGKSTKLGQYLSSFYEEEMSFFPSIRTIQTVSEYSTVVNHPISHPMFKHILFFKSRMHSILISTIQQNIETNINEHYFFVKALCELSLGKTEDALQTCEFLLSKTTHQEKIYSLIAKIQYSTQDYSKSLENVLKAIRISDGKASNFITQALILEKLGMLDEAVVILDKAIALDPSSHDAVLYKSIILLKMKHFHEGFSLFKEKTNLKSYSLHPELVGVKRWDGKVTEKNSILIYHDEGIGDIFLFLRFLFIVQKQFKTISLCVDKRLHPILAESFSSINLVSTPLEVEFDIFVFLSDLAYISGFELHEIIESYSPIRLPSNLIEDKIYSEHIQLGLSFRTSHCTSDIDRNILTDESFSFFEELPCQWNNLQNDLTSAEINKYKHWLKWTNSIDYKNDIPKLFSIMMQLDGVITIDNSIAHFAGILGIPTLLILPQNADWKWGLDDHTSYWYPSIQIYRINKPGKYIKPLLERLRLFIVEQTQKETISS